MVCSEVQIVQPRCKVYGDTELDGANASHRNVMRCSKEFLRADKSVGNKLRLALL